MDFSLLEKAMADLEEDSLLELVKEVLNAGGDEVDKAVEAMQKGMETVGERFENNEYFIGDLIYAGEIMTGAMAILSPLLKAGAAGGGGKLLLATVKDDLHDIGKNIVKAMLEAGGFDVVDLGVDVPHETIVKTAMEQNITIVALSGVLTLALDSMKEVVETFKAAGIREKIKIIIGGNPVSEEACKMIGADDWAHSPQKGVTICKGWAGQ